MSVIKKPKKVKGKSVVIHHRDLDGTFGFMVVKKFLHQMFGEFYPIERVGTGYERVNPKCEAYWQTANEYDFIIMVDICCDMEKMETAPKNVYVFDHHDTSQEICSENPNFYWDDNMCGATVAHKYLLGNKGITPEYKQMIKICDNYDMWRGDKGPLGAKPPAVSFKMNSLYNATQKIEDFINRFYHGFDGFNEKDLGLIKQYNERQTGLFKNMFKVVEKPLFVGVLEQWGLDINRVCHNLMEKKGFQAVMIIWKPTKRISLRLSPKLSGKIHAGNWLDQHVTNKHDSKGGHELAGGCSFDGTPLDDVMGWAEQLYEEIVSCG